MARTSTKTDEQKAADLAAKAERFKDVGASRTSKALDAIAKIKGCANKANYAWNEDQIAKIEAALNNEVAQTVAAFRGTGGVAKAGIQL